MNSRAVAPVILALAAVILPALPAAALTCASNEGHIDEAIRSGWPTGAPHEFVLIGTVADIRPIQGDSDTWGQIIVVRVDAVLRGDLELGTIEVFNPPLGASGWGPFDVGGQYLIAAHPPTAGEPGDVATWLCAPNERVTSQAQFDELVAYAPNPIVADTAMAQPGFDPGTLGWLVVVAAIGLGARRLARRPPDR